MLKSKVCHVRTSNLVGGWNMRYQLPWPASKGLVKLGYCTWTWGGEYRVGRTRDGHTTCYFNFQLLSELLMKRKDKFIDKFMASRNLLHYRRLLLDSVIDMYCHICLCI